VAIAMLEAETGRGAVYYQNAGTSSDKRKDGDILYIPGSEPEILKHFWRQMQRYGQFITFNGRSFDCPFIMLRSAINKIPAGRNLVPYRYSFSEHVDLLDQLTFYDALRRRFSLHLWCKAFGIPSPKAEGMSGLLVKELFTQAKYDDIAKYCLRDVLATKELFLRWEKCLRS
jgi:predicted PolB exonuclease-like 3'-5' exonuclease